MTKEEELLALPIYYANIRSVYGGMTLRDYFAGQVIKMSCDEDMEKTVKQAYRIADAMIVERNKGKCEEEPKEWKYKPVFGRVE